MTRPLIALVCLVAAVGCARPIDELMPAHGRLPGDVVPQAYTLDLTFDLEHGTLQGTSVMRLRLDQPRKTLWLHGRGLRIGAASLTLADGIKLTPTVAAAGADDLLKVTLPRVVGAQEVILSIAYGRSVEVTRGAVFANSGPMNGRDWFPCLDEPALKTPFDISVTAPADAMIVGPSAILEELGERRRLAPTKPIAPYLVSFVVGRVQAVGEGRVRGIALPEDASRFAYLVAQADPMLAKLERYLGQPYPFDKLDIVASPTLAAGAYENVAAIHIARDLALADPGDEKARRTAVEVLAHELTHMWFGDSVTPAWWDDIWLSEGLATLVSRRVLDLDADRVEVTLGAMHYDSISSALPVRHRVASTADLRYDPTVYGKAMSVMAMVEGVLGAEAFRAALGRYAEAHRYGRVTDKDFARAMENDTAARVLESFIYTPGLPWVTAEAECPKLTLKQTRYVPLGAATPPAAVWTIPVCTHDECWLLDTAEKTVEPKHCEPAPFINAHANGYYRFTYDGDLTPLDASELLAAIDSRAAAIIAGKATPESLLDALPVLTARKDHRLDHRVMEIARQIRRHHLDAATVPAFERFATRLFADRPRAFLGPRGESADEKLRRDTLVDFLVTVAREPALRAQAAAHGVKLLADPSLRGGKLVDVALETLCIGIAENTPEPEPPPSERCAEADIAALRETLGDSPDFVRLSETIHQCAALDSYVRKPIAAYLAR